MEKLLNNDSVQVRSCNFSFKFEIFADIWLGLHSNQNTSTTSWWLLLEQALFSKRVHSQNYQTMDRLPWWITENWWFHSWWSMLNKWQAWKIMKEIYNGIDGGATEGSQLFVGSTINSCPDVPTLVTKSIWSGNQTTFYLCWQPFNTYWTTKINFLRHDSPSHSHVMIFLLFHFFVRSWVGGVHERWTVFWPSNYS